jgi:hypothetical protein
LILRKLKFILTPSICISNFEKPKKLLDLKYTDDLAFAEKHKNKFKEKAYLLKKLKGNKLDDQFHLAISVRLCHPFRFKCATLRVL